MEENPPAIMNLANLQKTWSQSGFQLGPVNLTLPAGATLAVLGKNGSGKTTLFQLMTGNLDPDAGTILFQGRKFTPESFDQKRQIGYLPQHLELPHWVTGSEILTYATRLYQIPDPTRHVEETLTYWDSEGFRNKPLASCSHGMQKRIALGLAGIHDPDLLILDEPFSGLDLYHIRALENLIRHRSDTGKATIVCTHIAPYAARLCEEAMIMETGRCTPLEGWQQKSWPDRIRLMEDSFFPTGEN